MARPWVGKSITPPQSTLKSWLWLRRTTKADGLCAIDVLFQLGNAVDMVSSRMISDAADSILSRCVKGHFPTLGGFITGVGELGAYHKSVRESWQRTAAWGLEKSLVVVVRSYKPDVRCGSEYGAAPPIGTCVPAQLMVPVDNDRLRFGPRVQGARNEVITPKIFAVGEC